MVQIGQETTGALRKNKNDKVIKSIRDAREAKDNQGIVMGKRPGSGKKHI